jgi:hypothetical protein
MAFMKENVALIQLAAVLYISNCWFATHGKWFIISITCLGLMDWLIMMGVRLCLRTTATNGPIVHPPGDMWVWRAMVMTMMMLAGENSWLIHKSSLAVLPAEKSGASRSENFAYQYLKYLKEYLTCHKILWHGTCGFTFHLKEGVLWIFITLKNPSPWPCLNPQTLGPVASTLTTTPLRWLHVLV